MRGKHCPDMHPSARLVLIEMLIIFYCSNKISIRQNAFTLNISNVMPLKTINNAFALIVFISYKNNSNVMALKTIQISFLFSMNRLGNERGLELLCRSDFSHKHVVL